MKKKIQNDHLLSNNNNKKYMVALVATLFEHPPRFPDKVLVPRSTAK